MDQSDRCVERILKRGKGEAGGPAKKLLCQPGYEIVGVCIKLLVLNWWEVVKFWIDFTGSVVYRHLGGN